MMLTKIANKHRTLGTGVIIAVVGAAQMGLPQLQVALSPVLYGAIAFVLGLCVAGIGAYNTWRASQDAKDEAAAEEAGA